MPRPSCCCCCRSKNSSCRLVLQQQQQQLMMMIERKVSALVMVVQSTFGERESEECVQSFSAENRRRKCLPKAENDWRQQKQQQSLQFWWTWPHPEQQTDDKLEQTRETRKTRESAAAENANWNWQVVSGEMMCEHTHTHTTFPASSSVLGTEKKFADIAGFCFD